MIHCKFKLSNIFPYPHFSSKSISKSISSCFQYVVILLNFFYFEQISKVVKQKPCYFITLPPVSDRFFPLLELASPLVPLCSSIIAFSFSNQQSFISWFCWDGRFGFHRLELFALLIKSNLETWTNMPIANLLILTLR